MGMMASDVTAMAHTIGLIEGLRKQRAEVLAAKEVDVGFEHLSVSVTEDDLDDEAADPGKRQILEAARGAVVAYLDLKIERLMAELAKHGVTFGGYD